MQKIQETSSHQKERLIFLETWKTCEKWYKSQEQQRLKIRIILRFEEWEEEEERGRMQINGEGTVKHYTLILTGKDTIFNSLFGLRIWS